MEASALRQNREQYLVYRAHKRGAVMCDVVVSCATPGHIGSGGLTKLPQIILLAPTSASKIKMCTMEKKHGMISCALIPNDDALH